MKTNLIVPPLKNKVLKIPRIRHKCVLEAIKGIFSQRPSPGLLEYWVFDTC